LVTLNDAKKDLCLLWPDYTNIGELDLPRKVSIATFTHLPYRVSVVFDVYCGICLKALVSYSSSRVSYETRGNDYPWPWFEKLLGQSLNTGKQSFQVNLEIGAE
jgi:hypothetical protein